MDLNHRQTDGSETVVDSVAPSVAGPPEHVEALNELLADWLVFDQKLRSFRWTVTGPQMVTAEQPRSRLSAPYCSCFVLPPSCSTAPYCEGG